MQQALVADANAQKMIAEARGDSAQAVISAAGKARAEVIEAEGLAQAMKLKQQQLTPLYVDYLRVQAWDGKYPSTMLGGNSSALFNMK
jgi:regulator of protease activity HflC (stomatin/prohibitin superfamily)